MNDSLPKVVCVDPTGVLTPSVQSAAAGRSVTRVASYDEAAVTLLHSRRAVSAIVIDGRNGSLSTAARLAFSASSHPAVPDIAILGDEGLDLDPLLFGQLRASLIQVLKSADELSEVFERDGE